MSFLAQLRQNQNDHQSKVSICYHFDLDLVGKNLELSFSLSELKSGKLVEMGKPYTLQHAHLQHAPPFLQALDVEILSTLSDSDPRWFSQSRGWLPAKNHDQIIAPILATGRCFIRSKTQQWQSLSLARPVDVSLQWKRANDGSYNLEWRTEADFLLLPLVSAIRWPIAVSPVRAEIALVKTDLCEAAIGQLVHTPDNLPADEVDDFIAANASRWHACRLPLPKPAKLIKVDARIQPVLHFSSDTVALIFRYSSNKYSALVAYQENDSTLEYWDGQQIVRLRRDRQSEQAFQKRLSSQLEKLDTRRLQGRWQMVDDSDWRKIVIDFKSKLMNAGFHFWFDQTFRFHYVDAESWQLTISDHTVSDNGDGFKDDGIKLDGIKLDDSNSDRSQSDQIKLQLFAQIEGQAVSIFELLHQLKDFNQKLDYLRLNDGRLLLLPADKVSGLLEELGDLFRSHTSALFMPKSQVNRLDKLQQSLPANTDWQGAVENLALATSLYQTPQLLENLTQGVKADLRPYQWLGVCWFQHLKQCGVNGLLADDMGLGKTLQTLTHLSLEAQQGQLESPALIVAPTSLLHNWAAEIQKFTPHLRYKIIHGANRAGVWGQLDQYDIIITSYQLVVNDQQQWQQQSLSWLILDEAQTIKNSRTKARQALREISSQHRLCLSGTPVENHLGELWSLLDFLNPEMLGGQQEFKRYYQKPIEQDADETRMSHLKRRIEPFVLRRTKEQVAQELPAKTIIEQCVDMFNEQRAFYEAQKSHTEDLLQQQTEQTEHAGQQQMLLLNALMKLRQICCDPGLLGESGIRSAKRQHCIEMVEELVAEGRFILIFSQFTQMLDLLAEDLQTRNIPYLCLTGQSKNRHQLVEQFQSGSTPVFLISLKAGGVGLNLTQADTVIHYDPWWNSAAEQQATDRAHRIGQDKPVFVYKLICEGTIEEKIAQLQRHKAQLSEHINQQAQLSGEKFALKLEDLMSLWQQELKKV